jgi:thioesterase domain-containing protein/acyl carrier protein
MLDEGQDGHVCGPDARNYRLTSAQVAAQVAEIWRGVLGVPHVAHDVAFTDLGGDSLTGVQVLSEIEVTFDVELEVSDFIAAPTVADIAALVLRADDPAPRDSLVRFQPGSGGPPLFLFHPLSGTVMRYVALVQALGDDIPTWGLRAIGLEPGETPLGSIEEMATSHLEAMERVHPGGPWHLVGYSLGGILAFEVAQQLRARGATVGLLCLLDTPSAAGGVPPEDVMRARGLRSLARSVLPIGAPEDLDEIMAMADHRQIPALIERARAAGSLPDGYDVERLDRLLETRVHTRVVASRYRPTSYDGHIDYVRALEPSAEDPEESREDPSGLWRSLASSLRRHTVHSNHLDMLEGASGSAIADLIAAAVR